MVNRPSVHIILDCILVVEMLSLSWPISIFRSEISIDWFHISLIFEMYIYVFTTKGLFTPKRERKWKRFLKSGKDQRLKGKHQRKFLFSQLLSFSVFQPMGTSTVWGIKVSTTDSPRCGIQVQPEIFTEFFFSNKILASMPKWTTLGKCRISPLISPQKAPEQKKWCRLHNWTIGGKKSKAQIHFMDVTYLLVLSKEALLFRVQSRSVWDSLNTMPTFLIVYKNCRWTLRPASLFTLSHIHLFWCCAFYSKFWFYILLFIKQKRIWSD